MAGCTNCGQSPDEPLALSLLETKFPDAPIERFGLCYMGVVNRQTALKSFAQDLMAGAVAGFPGMILFGGNPDYYANVVIVGLQNNKLVLCELGYVPVRGTSLESITITYGDASEALALTLKEPEKIEHRSAALADLEFSLSLEGRLCIKGTIVMDLEFIDCPGTRALTSAKEALLLFERLGNFPKPRELLLQLKAGRINFPVSGMKKAISTAGYISTLKDDFSDLAKEKQAAILNRHHVLPEPLRLFFVNWFREYRNRAPKLILIAVATTALTIVCLLHIINGLLYHADEPSGFLGLVSFVIGIPGVLFSGILWFAVAHNIRFRRWYKRLTINEFRAHTVLIQER